LLVALAVVPLLTATASWSARALDDADAPTLTVTSFAPTVGRAGTDLAVTGTVSGGAESLEDTVVRLRVASAPVLGRSELAAIADNLDDRSGETVATEDEGSDLAAGQSRSWSLSRPLDELSLPTTGVYPVTVELASRSTGAQLARVTTFLTWYPDGTAVQSTRTAWVVPMVGTPSRDADGVFLDDSTAAAVAPGGRLRSLLDAATGTPATWAVDPELLEAVQDMSDGYRVRTEDGGIESGGAAGAAAARTFLEDLTAAVVDADVAALGYADPDVNALQRGSLESDITLATTTGPEVAETILGRSVRSDLAWPPGDAAQRATLATLRSAGITDVLLSDTTLPVDPALPYTPTGLARVPTKNGAVTAALIDSTLTGVVSAPQEQGGDVLAAQRYLAETLMITQQLPSEPRTIVVVPTRGWDVDPAFARTLLTLQDRAPWLEASSLDALLNEPLPDAPRGGFTYPESARQAEISTEQVDGIRALGESVTTFTAVLADAEATSTRLTSALLRTTSGAFRERGQEGAELLAAVTGEVEDERAKVRILSRGSVTLSGASGQVPITIANDLDQAVVIDVRLTPSSSIRLKVDQPGQLRLGPRLKETIEVRAEAATSGTVPVEVALLTPDGAVYSEPVTIDVRSTAYSRVGLAVVGVAGIALLLLVGARLVRRVRHARRAGAE
jgi:hypothetical protein